MKIRLLIPALLLALSAFGQQDSAIRTLKIHFLYGSKPARGFKHTEEKYFGGIHGGHVSLEFDSMIFSFMPDRYPVHIFSHKHQRHSGYYLENKKQFAGDTAGSKVVSIIIPLTDSEYFSLEKLKSCYLGACPYDYAFFGMRCAAAAYDVLGQIGVVEKYSRWKNIFSNFYPKLLRKKMLKYARAHHLKIIRKKGRPSRKWEKD